MFGLMQFSGCQKTDEELYRRRLLYCGTCKAIGSEYGQSARMLLNNDVVFLAEILQAISSEPTSKFENWAPAFQSYNCLALPEKIEVPMTLRIAASVSMILSELKLEDHIDDSSSIVFRGAKKCLDPVFTKSESDFAKLEFPMQKIRTWFDQQSIRERDGVRLKPSNSQSLELAETHLEKVHLTQDELLATFAEPTAMITAIVFEHSGGVVSGNNFKTTMHRLGFGFGSLIYIIDALEDFERDFRTSSFNGIACAYHLENGIMPGEIELAVENELKKHLKELDLCINELPIPSAQKQEYSDRLWRNVRRKTRLKLHNHRAVSQPVSIEKSHVSKAKESCNKHAQTSLKSRWETACATASNLTSEIAPSCNSKLILSIGLTYRAFIYLFVLLIAFLSPVQSRSIRSYRECVELPFNLMFWGAAIATIINSFVQAGNKSFAYAHAMVGGGNELESSAERNRNQFREQTDSVRLTETSSSSDQPPDGDNDDHADNNRARRRGVTNDNYRHSRMAERPVPMCFCSDGCCCTWGSGEACCEGSECCCESTDCCVGGTDCCTGCECCGGGAECCSGGGIECCGGGGECCSGGGIECCAAGCSP
jgi:hypothetical protein